MTDTLASRAIIGVMTPAMNTVVQPELEALRPLGVTNQMQRFRLGGDRISEDLFDEAEKLMDCHPRVLAVGLTTDAGPGGVAKLASVCDELQNHVGIPVCIPDGLVVPDRERRLLGLEPVFPKALGDRRRINRNALARHHRSRRFRASAHRLAVRRSAHILLQNEKVRIPMTRCRLTVLHLHLHRRDPF